MTPSRMQVLECRDFVEAGEALAKRKAKIWSGALRRKIRAVFLRTDLTRDEKIAEGVRLVNEAPDLPKLPPVSLDELLNTLTSTAEHLGITPTIALRGDLRRALVNKPPAKLAAALTQKIFDQHREFQALAKTQTRH